MQLPENIQTFIAMVLLAGIASVSDLRKREIPNGLVLTGLFIGVVFSLVTKGWVGLGDVASGFAVGFLLMLPGYLLRRTGAGDVKLMATLGTFCGPLLILQIFVVSVLSGAGLILLKGLYCSGYRALSNFAGNVFALSNLSSMGRLTHKSREPDSLLRLQLPMAPVYTLGMLIVFLFAPFGP